jgi:hypothetical protein
MMRDDDFEPKLGRFRTSGDMVRSRFAQEVERAVALEGGRKRGGASSRHLTFEGSRIGRGAGVGRVMLASRDCYAALRTRRVVIKTRIIKLAGRGLKGARTHLRYPQRDGVTAGAAGRPLRCEAGLGRADSAAFLERSDGDRHQFRFIVSAEDAIEYENLKHFTRRVLNQAERDETRDQRAACDRQFRRQ